MDTSPPRVARELHPLHKLALALVSLAADVLAAEANMRQQDRERQCHLRTSFVLELLVYPAIYKLWKQRELGHKPPLSPFGKG